MSVVIEPLDSAVSIVATMPVRAPLRPATPAARGRPLGHWKSELTSRDLQCLLHVLECDLIPRLLTEYSPARHAPLDPDTASG